MNVQNENVHASVPEMLVHGQCQRECEDRKYCGSITTTSAPYQSEVISQGSNSGAFN